MPSMTEVNEYLISYMKRLDLEKCPLRLMQSHSLIYKETDFIAHVFKALLLLLSSQTPLSPDEISKFKEMKK